jgi:hypothetical protein
MRVNRVESYFEVESTKGRRVPISSSRRCLKNVRCLRNVRKGEGGELVRGVSYLALIVIPVKFFPYLAHIHHSAEKCLRTSYIAMFMFFYLTITIYIS